jgi:peptide/nickel transport system ATP-binding protein
MSDVILSVRKLCKHYPIIEKGFVSRQVGMVKACDDVSFDLKRGETLGIVGESGSGKTTLGRAILRATRPTSGCSRTVPRRKAASRQSIWQACPTRS